MAGPMKFPLMRNNILREDLDEDLDAVNPDGPKFLCPNTVNCLKYCG